MIIRTITALIVIFAASVANATPIAVFDTSNGSALEASTTPDGDNLSVSELTLGEGLSGVPTNSKFIATGWDQENSEAALIRGDFFEFTLSPENGASYSLSSLLFFAERSAFKGLPSFFLATSVNNFQPMRVSDLDTSFNVGPPRSFHFDLSENDEFQNLSEAITIRILGTVSIAGAEKPNGLARMGLAKDTERFLEVFGEIRTVGNVSEVPIPAALPLFLLGAGLIRLKMRR